ncbi:Acetyl esterase/lipase [Pseudobutyrivibrio ruminis]|uniref:Acetyl esterase/lipase n=1 Tax=Pseudobutyrivibrio ruminis TaxID=46206 RepID=A0A1H7F180_9FIRM|nr:alpha/beta hydrolase [Pseudobutyrivibrio ruminis]SEK19851.1 Acetyl esterase/lipase [Pseudobutyrivibrio ruminis]
MRNIYLFANGFGETVRTLIIAYLILTFVFTVYSVARMYYIEHKSNNVKGGRARVKELQASGRFRQIPVYSMEEMSKDKHKRDVRLMYFPADNPKSKRFVVVLPGGGYAHLCTRQEGYPVAAALNEMGVNAFVLEYRTGRDCEAFAPMQDLGTALQMIQQNQDQYGVTLDGYALIGFSAGGNLAGIFSSHKFGYMDYQLPKPGAVILGYPWTCVNDWLHHPYWNIWIGLMGIWLSNRGSFHMFGLRHIRRGRVLLDVQKYIEDDYPPTFMYSGSWDVLVPASRHADVFESALKAHGINHIYEKYFGVPHGIGLGIRTKAEGWLDRAVEFWESVI